MTVAMTPTSERERETLREAQALLQHAELTGQVHNVMHNLVMALIGTHTVRDHARRVAQIALDPNTMHVPKELMKAVVALDARCGPQEEHRVGAPPVDMLQVPQRLYSDLYYEPRTNPDDVAHELAQKLQARGLLWRSEFYTSNGQRIEGVIIAASRDHAEAIAEARLLGEVVLGPVE